MGNEEEAGDNPGAGEVGDNPGVDRLLPPQEKRRGLCRISLPEPPRRPVWRPRPVRRLRL
jgi:hypothetical protein